MFCIQEQSLQRTKKRKEDGELSGDKRKMCISGIQDKEEKGSHSWDLLGELWRDQNHMEGEMCPYPLRAI